MTKSETIKMLRETLREIIRFYGGDKEMTAVRIAKEALKQSKQ